jgi:hypothetical protein
MRKIKKNPIFTFGPSHFRIITVEMEKEEVEEVKSHTDSAIASEIDLSKPTCFETSRRSDTCEARGEARVEGESRRIFVRPMAQEWKIKPYCRKHDAFAQSHVREWTLLPFGHMSPPPACTKNHSVPALLFSIGGNRLFWTLFFYLVYFWFRMF